MRKLQLMSIILLSLIVSLPIVSAQELSLVRYAGKEAVNGYSRLRDELIIETVANIPQEQIIDREQVRFYIGESYAFFDNCTREANSTRYRCVFTEPEFESYEPLDFQVRLLNDDGRELLVRQAKLTPDNIAPLVNNVTVEPRVTRGDAQVVYRTQDFALDPQNAESCSGIKEVSVTLKGRSIATDTGRIGLCSKDNGLALVLNESGSVCVSASDFAGHRSSARCQTIRVDKLPPSIESAQITDTDGLPLTHMKTGEEIIGTLTVRVTDDGEVDSRTVLAQLNGLNKVLGESAANTVDGSSYVWTGVPVTETSGCKVSVKASDTLSNDAAKEFSCAIGLDNTAPVLKGIVSEKSRDGVPLLNSGEVLVVEFEDLDDARRQGIGLGARRAFIDLSALGMRSAERPMGCVQRGSVWQCSYVLSPSASVVEGKYKAKVTAADNLGNAVEGEIEFFYDNTPPEPARVVNLTIFRGSTGQRATQGAIEGDFIQAYVRSKGFIKSSVDASQVGGDEDSPSKFCTAPDGEPADCTIDECDCFFEQQVLLSGPYAAELTFKVFDDAGNAAQNATVVEVYGIENQTRPRYWTPEVTCTPELVDRSVASKINQYVSCRVHLQSAVANIAPFSIKGPDDPSLCSGDAAININDISVTNDFEGSRDPFLFIKLEAKDYYVNKLNFTCPISIITKRTVGEKKFLTPQPQIVQANISIGFYNEPLRDMYSNIDRQIEKAMSDGLASQKWLGDLRKFLHYADVICQIKTIITSLINALFTITSIIGLAKEALYDSGVGAAGGAALDTPYTVACEAEEGLAEGYGAVSGVIKALDVLCSFVNCQATSGGKNAWGIPGVGGGGVPYCEKLQEIAQLVPGVGMGIEQAGMSAFNIKDSLVWSTICLCLPGIVYNLEKLRQVHCFKAVCLHDQVKEEGYPVSYCNEMYGFLKCQFIVGQVFAAIPFAQFFEKIINFVTTLITDPVAMFTLAIGAVCSGACLLKGNAPTAIYIGCAITKVIATSAEAITSVTHMTKTKGYFSNPGGNQYCKRMERIEKDYKKKEKEQAQATAGNQSQEGAP